MLPGPTPPYPVLICKKMRLALVVSASKVPSTFQRTLAVSGKRLFQLSQSMALVLLREGRQDLPQLPVRSVMTLVSLQGLLSLLSWDPICQSCHGEAALVAQEIQVRGLGP